MKAYKQKQFAFFDIASPKKAKFNTKHLLLWGVIFILLGAVMPLRKTFTQIFFLQGVESQEFILENKIRISQYTHSTSGSIEDELLKMENRKEFVLMAKVHSWLITDFVSLNLTRDRTPGQNCMFLYNYMYLYLYLKHKTIPTVQLYWSEFCSAL